MVKPRVIETNEGIQGELTVEIFVEIHRVLKPGGRFCITDMRRDVNPLIKWMIYHSTKPKEIRPGFLTSLNAACTVSEMSALLERSELKNAEVKSEFLGLCISGDRCSID